MMKKNLLLTVAVAVLALGSSAAQAAEESATGNIKAKIVAPVSISEQDSLDFGTMIAPTYTSKKVTIATNGTRSGDSSILVGNGGQAGLFNVTGADRQSMTISVTDSTTLTGAGDPMTVNNFVTEPASTLTLTGTSGQIKVGADLTVGQGQAEGDYTGTYEVTVSY